MQRRYEKQRKCKNSRLSRPLGYSGVTHRVHLWLDGKRIVDFLLVIIELFSIAFTAVALFSENCQNRRVTVSANFRYIGTSLAIRSWTVRKRNDVPTTFSLEVYTQGNFVAYVFRQKLNFTGKNSKIVFCATLWVT